MARGSKVLVMDDADRVRGLLAELLREIETVADVIEAADAGAALRLVAEQQPDIAILDIHVPGEGPVQNGIDVLRVVKQVRPETKVFMLTSHGSDQHRLECQRAGADHFFDKTLEFEALLDRVAEYQDAERRQFLQ